MICRHAKPATEISMARKKNYEGYSPADRRHAREDIAKAIEHQQSDEAGHASGK